MSNLLQELEQAMRMLKSLRSLRSISRNKSHLLLQRQMTDASHARIDYFGSLSDPYRDELVNTFNDLFGVRLHHKDIEWNERNTLKGGARLFLDDDLYDLSLTSAQKCLNLQ